MNKLNFVGLGLMLVIVIGGAWLAFKQTGGRPEANSFEDCVKFGYPIQESYPARCVTPQGKSFTQNIGNELEKTDLIQISNPRPTQKISSPLVITGEAVGSWYFEASFPVELFDANNLLLATTIAEAQADWMTEDFVPYQATLTFGTPTTTTGYLVLHKDNPSGEPQNDDQLTVPIVF